MRYISTRGDAPVVEFEEVMLTGLARDGGLYLPEHWPHFSTPELHAMRGESYADLAATVMRPFLGANSAAQRFDDLMGRAYGGFGHSAVTPLKQLDHELWVMELFHGPTLAF